MDGSSERAAVLVFYQRPNQATEARTRSGARIDPGQPISIDPR